MASQTIGGYLILGAERGDAGWTLPGLDFPQEEPATWITSVLDRGLEPSPDVDVKAFERSKGRHAAVVRVPPIAVPPSITVDGTVYRRVSGQTQPVTSQVVLTELLEAGRAARREAEGKALRAAQSVLGEAIGRLSRDANMFAVAVCPVQGPEDRAQVLFTEPFLAALRELVDTRLQPWGERYRVAGATRQTQVRAYPVSHKTGLGRMVIAHWDGAVATVYAAVPGEESSRAEVGSEVEAAWSVSADVAERLHGSGETHVVVAVNREHPLAARADVAPMPIQRWTVSVQPAADDIGRVQRELGRALGTQELEP